MPRRAAAVAPLLLCVTACGGGSPTAPAPIPLHELVAIVFYDENGNGLPDAGEVARVPDVELQVAGRTGRSEKGSGRTVIGGVPAGSHPLRVETRTLPPFYAPPGTTITAPVPQAAGADVMVPLTLPIGGNVPNTYMGFGDSITVGEGSSDGRGYRDRLQSKLGQHFGRGTVVNQGVLGTRSNFGAQRIGQSLDRTRPAYTLILYGTNDWNQNECKTAFPCYTPDSLRQMVREARAASSLPLLATIIPCNVGFDERAPPERNEWIARMDELIRPLAREEGAVLVDLERAFLRQPSLSGLFVDHVHPNDAGYEIIASEFFDAITRPVATTGAAGAPPVALGSSSAAAKLRVLDRAQPGKPKTHK